MRTVSLSLLLAAGLAAAAHAQTPAPATAPPATTTTTTVTTAPPAATTAAPPASTTTTTTTTTTAQPGTAAPDATAAPPAEAAPTLPTTGDGAVIIQALEKVCIPLVRGGNLDQLAPQIPGARKNRRDGTWTAPLGGASRDYNITFQPQGVNKDVCLADVHFAIGGDAEIVKAVNVWSFLHKPELILQANYVAVDADGVKRVRKSWEHLESASSTAVNFTTWRKPDDSPLNRNYDTGQLYYQERHF